MDSIEASKKIEKAIELLISKGLSIKEISSQTGISSSQLSKAKGFYLKCEKELKTLKKQRSDFKSKGKRFPEFAKIIDNHFGLKYNERTKSYYKEQDIQIKSAAVYHLFYYKKDTSKISQGIINLSKTKADMHIYGSDNDTISSKWKGDIFSVRNHQFISVTKTHPDKLSKCLFVFYNGMMLEPPIITGVYSSVQKNGIPSCGKILFLKSENDGQFLNEIDWRIQNYLFDTQITSEMDMPYNLDKLSIDSNIINYVGKYNFYYPSKIAEEPAKGVLEIFPNKSVKLNNVFDEEYLGCVNAIDLSTNVLEIELQEVGMQQERIGLKVYILTTIFRKNALKNCHSGMLVSRDEGMKPASFPLLLVGSEIDKSIDIDSMNKEYFKDYYGRLISKDHYEMKALMNRHKK